MADICVEVGRRIRRLRLKRSWRQIDLAAHAELSVTHISYIESGKKELCLYSLERIALALETTPAELLR